MSFNNSRDFQSNLFYEMLRIRLIEEFIASEYPKQYMRCPTHLSIGQEAVAVGVCQNLKESDYVLSNHRAHAHFLAKGGSLKKMFAEIMGKESGCCKGRGGSMHLVDMDKGFLGSTPIVAGTIPIAVGVALSISLKKQNKIAVVFLGDGASETGVFSESLNFAALKKLPILFVCENNLYSVYSPLNVRQAEKRDRVKIAQAHGLYAKKDFGSDAEKVYSATQEAIEIIKNEKIPCFLEFDTYRYKEHCGPNMDNHLNYRPLEEYNQWLEKCPIKIQKKKLLENNLLTKSEIQQMRSTILDEIKEADIWAKNEKMINFNIVEEEKIFL